VAIIAAGVVSTAESSTAEVRSSVLRLRVNSVMALEIKLQSGSRKRSGSTGTLTSVHARRATRPLPGPQVGMPAAKSYHTRGAYGRCIRVPTTTATGVAKVTRT